MDTKCAACQQAITSSRLLKCTYCKVPFHPICVNAATTDPSKLINWQCPSCKAKEPKNSNLNSPVQHSDRTDVSNAKAMTRAPKRMALSSPTQTKEDIAEQEHDPVASELRLLRLEMAEITSCFKLLTESLAKCNLRLDKLEPRMKTLEEKDQIIASLVDSVQQMQDQINLQSQAALKNEIEIIGINETTNENLEHIVLVTATKFGVNLSESEIDWVVRAGPKHMKNGNKESSLPRPIIVRLSKKAKRDEILKAAKVRRHSVITSADLDLQGPPRNIYLNEHLTKANRLLFRDARSRAKEHGFRYCWVSNGKIHVRRDEGKPAIPIKSSADLDRVLPVGLHGASTPIPSRV